MMLDQPRPLASRMACTETCAAAATVLTVSPRAIVYAAEGAVGTKAGVGAAAGCGAAVAGAGLGAAAAEDVAGVAWGRTIAWPGKMMLARPRPFALRTAAVERPWAAAMPLIVSPVFTR